MRCATAARWRQHIAGPAASGELGYVEISVVIPADGGEPTIEASDTALLSPLVCARLEEFRTARVKPTRCMPQSSATPPGRGGRTVPCYLAGRAAATMPAEYWRRYQAYVEALLTLAHESVHLGGVVGGRLPDGTYVGDRAAEMKAECYGMQWLRFVAQQLGAQQDDAAAIARFQYEKVYPLMRSSGSSYWSPQCVRGGAHDIVADGSRAFP